MLVLASWFQLVQSVLFHDGGKMFQKFRRLLQRSDDFESNARLRRANKATVGRPGPKALPGRALSEVALLRQGSPRRQQRLAGAIGVLELRPAAALSAMIALSSMQHGAIQGQQQPQNRKTKASASGSTSTTLSASLLA